MITALLPQIVRQSGMAKVTTKPETGKKLSAKKAVKGSDLDVRGSQTPSMAVVEQHAVRSPKPSYATLVQRLATELGVKVAAMPDTSAVNPYRASSAVTKKALQSVGVLTRSGKLSPRLK